MTWNTKDWQDRLTEIYNAINYLGDEQGMEYAQTVAVDLRQKIESLPGAKQQKQYSNSLHIDGHKNLDKDARKWLRTLAAIEELLVQPHVQRNFAAVVGHYRGTPAPQIKKAVKDLIKSLDPFPASPDMGRVRPLLMGCSVSGGGHPGPGSICCFVTDALTGKVGLLSNQHVIRAEGLDKGDPVTYQPARNNGGTSVDNVGKFVRGFLDADLDAAFCELDDTIAWQNATRDTPRLASAVIAGINTKFNKDDVVWKCGAMSGVTRGRIKAVSVDKSVPHNERVGGAVNFTKQIQVESTIGKPFQIPGDSGSALLNQNNEIIGLLHAGGADGFALATPIEVVFDKLKVKLA